ncbi:hypothetical protein ACFWXK_15590 [Streptomyces sp. NPDC059070]|uniref:hypothetical protein n=1 Tax=Streptomyces sp. NPDC059070 TaxID=3346713 RepID=UPI00369A9A91
MKKSPLMANSVMAAYRDLVLKQLYGNGVSRTEAIRRKQHGARLTATKMEARRVDCVSNKWIGEFLYQFGDQTYGFSVGRLGRGSGTGYKVFAYWPGEYSAVSQTYLFRDRREAIRAVQHRRVQETSAYVYWTVRAYRRAEKRRRYVGDHPFQRTVLWHSDEQW